MRRILDNAEVTKKEGFWKRQFAADPTAAQDRFDLWFGVALPVACFVLDPAIFKGGILGRGLLEAYRLFAYMVSALEIGMFLCWFTFRRDLAEFAAPFAGVLVAGAIFSMVIGVVLLPLSVFATLFVIGIAGFTPFFTAFVYLRNGVRAMKAQLNNSTFGLRYLIALLAAFLVLVFPLFWSAYLQGEIPGTHQEQRAWDETWDGD